MRNPEILTATESFVTSRDRYRQDDPKVIGAFLGLKEAAMDGGALDLSMKALVAALMGVAHQSERCILTHVRAAREAGVTREELLDGLALAIAFGGAPGYGFACLALDVYDTVPAGQVA